MASGSNVVANPRPAGKMKWQQAVDGQKADEAGGASDGASMQLMREKRGEKKVRCRRVTRREKT